MTIERKIESVQEYNLLKLLKANSDLKRFGVEWIKLDHALCRVFATNGYAIIVEELEKEYAVSETVINEIENLIDIL